jgi:predicted ATPase
MALVALNIRGYRSLRRVRLPLQRLNVITGPNGSGKSNLYRALWLISQICEGDFARSICREGGLLSVMWAGPRTDAKKPLRMSLGFETDDLTFQITCGFPPLSRTLFCYDPQIKEELV